MMRLRFPLQQQISIRPLESVRITIALEMLTGIIHSVMLIVQEFEGTKLKSRWELSNLILFYCNCNSIRALKHLVFEKLFNK